MKHLTGFLALFLFAVLPLSAADLSDLTWTTTDGEVTISNCRLAATGELVIPDTIEGNPVTSIGNDAFADCSSLTSITIPDSVTSIGRNAFVGCVSLTSVVIGNGVTSIGGAAFSGCTNLTSITIGDGLTSIGGFAFFRCESLTSIAIPDSVTSIGIYAFYECTSLTSINIPDGVTGIGRYTFSLCSSLTSITIPASVTSIGDYAFEECRSLTRITFQGSAPDVGVDAFSNVAGGDTATVTAANLSSFGSEGESWNGFILNAFVDPMVADLEAQLAEAIAERDAAIAERDAAIADRDATVEELRTAQVERDSILSDIQLAYDEVNAATGGAAEEDLVAVAPTTIFDLVWTNSGDPTDTIEMTIEFPQATLPNPVYFMFDTVRPPIGTVLTIDYQGTVTVINEPNIIFISVLPLDFSQELMGQNGFDVTVGGLGSGDFNLEAEVPEGTFTGQDYFTLRAPDGSEYILTSMLAPAPSRFSSLELNPLTELYSSLVATNEEAIAERDAAIAERDACPTTEELAAVEAERDARFTEDQIRGLSADYTIGLNAAGNVQMKFNLFESADLNTFAPLTLNPDSVSVVDGSICLEFTPEDRAAFFRFSVE